MEGLFDGITSTEGFEVGFLVGLELGEIPSNTNDGAASAI